MAIADKRFLCIFSHESHPMTRDSDENPFGSYCILISEKGKKMVSWYDRKPGRALSNHEVAPLNQREISISRISSHSLCVKKDYLTDATIRISKCSDVRFYFCGSIKNVLVDSCHSCTLIFSAVSSIAKINDSHNCTIIVGARLVHISNTVDWKCEFMFSPRMFIKIGFQNIYINGYFSVYCNTDETNFDWAK